MSEVAISRNEIYNESYFSIIESYQSLFEEGLSLFIKGDKKRFEIKRSQLYQVRDEISSTFKIHIEEVCKFCFTYHDYTNASNGILNNNSEDHLYFVSSGDSIKIGRTISPARRISELQVSNHRKLKFLKIVRNKGCYEKVMHKIFSHLNIIGEWFEYDDEIIDLIKKL